MFECMFHIFIFACLPCVFCHGRFRMSNITSDLPSHVLWLMPRLLVSWSSSILLHYSHMYGTRPARCPLRILIIEEGVLPIFPADACDMFACIFGYAHVMKPLDIAAVPDLPAMCFTPERINHVWCEWSFHVVWEWARESRVWPNPCKTETISHAHLPLVSRSIFPCAWLLSEDFLLRICVLGVLLCRRHQGCSALLWVLAGICLSRGALVPCVSSVCTCVLAMFLPGDSFKLR